MTYLTPMLQPRSIRSNFAWTLAGYAVYAGCQWGMLVALAKLGTAGMVGQFALGLAVTAPLLLFANLQLRSVLATDARSEYAFPDYLGLRLSCTLLALLMLPVIAAASRANATTFAVIVLVGIAKGVEAISDIYFGLRQHHEEMQPIARSLIAKGLLSLMAFWLALRLSGSLVYAIGGLILAWGLVLLIYDRRVSHLMPEGASTAPRFSPGMMSRLARRSLPLGLMSMLVSLNGNIPRYFIESHLGAAALGIFAALVYPMNAGTLVAAALAQAALPVLARRFAHRDEIGGHFLRLLVKISTGGLLLGTAGILLCLTSGRRLLAAFYRPEYAEHVNALVWLAVAATLNYTATFLNAGVTATREFSVLTRPYILLAILALGLSASLISYAGLLGAAWASCGISAAGCAIPIAILARIHWVAQASACEEVSPRPYRWGNRNA
jgi:O-antigen/teichoic acid export membrane protein